MCFFSPEFIWISVFSVFSVLLMYSHIEYGFPSFFVLFFDCCYLRVLHKVFLLYMACAVKCGSSSNKCPGRIIIYIRKKCRVFRDGCFNMGYWPAISFGPWIDGSANSPFLFSVEGRHLGISEGTVPAAQGQGQTLDMYAEDEGYFGSKTLFFE